MAAPSLFTDPLVINVILPFLLVFVVVYTLLQKIQILGQNKQANVIIALIIGFIFIGVPSAVGVTLNIIPIIAVVLVILLCFMLIFGFSGIEVQKNKGIKIAVGIILGLTMIAIIIWATGIQFPALTEEAINYIIIFGFVIGAGAAIISAPSKSATKT